MLRKSFKKLGSSPLKPPTALLRPMALHAPLASDGASAAGTVCPTPEPCSDRLGVPCETPQASPYVHCFAQRSCSPTRSAVGTGGCDSVATRETGMLSVGSSHASTDDEMHDDELLPVDLTDARSSHFFVPLSNITARWPPLPTRTPIAAPVADASYDAPAALERSTHVVIASPHAPPPAV